jgi:TIR domain
MLYEFQLVIARRLESRSMSRIFISHSSRDDKRAIEVRDWLAANGWDDVFLDLDPIRGLAPGERWQNALKAAADRCEAVLFLISASWLNSRWCLSEYLLAKQLGKRLFPIIIESVDLSALPADMTADHQAVHLVLDPQGWERLKQGLKRAGLDANSFSFPTGRRPYPGFEPLTEEDAAVFFGRDAQVLRTLDHLRLMRDAGAERVLVVLGASGAGKSSFLRAGLWPRLRRDDRNFWPLPVIRPERAVLTGRSGLHAALEGAHPPTTKLLTVVGSNDVTGIIDDEGHAVGRPIGSSDIDQSFTNDAAWLDEQHFILATGEWIKLKRDSRELTLFNPALRLYRVDGTPAHEYLIKHAAPITSVAVLERDGTRTILAGDAVGNLIAISATGEVRITPTGVPSPIKKIVVSEWAKFFVALVFSRFDPERALTPSEQNLGLDPEKQKRKIESALDLPVEISYLGHRLVDNIGCAIKVRGGSLRLRPQHDLRL